MPKITQLYAYVIEDTGPDDEGVPAFNSPGLGMMPLMGADQERMDDLRVVAVELAALHGKPIKLLRSTELELVETIHPGGSSED